MIIWQIYSSDPDNADRLATIARWWQDLNQKEVTLAQRLLPENGNFQAIDWNQQKFDEKFTISQAQIRGITLYWQKSGLEVERNLTPRRLELDPNNQKLYIYPQSQQQLVVKVEIAEINYPTLELEDPLIVGTSIENKCILLLRDRTTKMQVKLVLNPQSLAQLLENLPR